MADIPLTTIRNVLIRRTKIMVQFGKDRHYDMEVLIDPTIADDDLAADGIYRPGARLTIGGLDKEENAAEVTVERWLGEDELRAMGKALLAAAGKLRRIESARRSHDPAPRCNAPGRLCALRARPAHC